MSAHLMQSLARHADKTLNGNVGRSRNGFVILAFPFDKLSDGQVNYVSNAQREDIIVSLKEIIARLEGRLQETETKQ